MNQFPNDVELLIYNYLHQICLYEIKKELIRNQKSSFIYKLKWDGFRIKYNVDIYVYDSFDLNRFCKEEHDRMIKDPNISCLYFRKKLEKELESLFP
jgi:hypothetical protein